MIEYHHDELVLRIPTASAEASHCRLLKALAASVRWFSNAEATTGDSENIYCIAEFLEEVTPTEKQLQ